MAISQVVAARADNGDLYNIIPPNKSDLAGGNGGAVTKASDSSLLDGVQTSRYSSGVFGSTVLDGVNTNKALPGGVFRYDNEQPVAKRISTSLANVNNDVLQSGASQPQLTRSIHKIESVRTRKLTKAIRNNKWNEYSGKFDVGYPEVENDTFYNIRDLGIVIDGSPIDDAADPTRSVPGELTYKSNSPLPVNDDYTKKTG